MKLADQVRDFRSLDAAYASTQTTLRVYRELSMLRSETETRWRSIRALIVVALSWFIIVGLLFLLGAIDSESKSVIAVLLTIAAATALLVLGCVPRVVVSAHWPTNKSEEEGGDVTLLLARLSAAGNKLAIARAAIDSESDYETIADAIVQADFQRTAQQCEVEIARMADEIEASRKRKLVSDRDYHVACQYINSVRGAGAGSSMCEVV